jgi:hypothetical protein
MGFLRIIVLGLYWTGPKEEAATNNWFYEESGAIDGILKDNIFRLVNGTEGKRRQSIANLRTRQAHQLGCFVYTEGIFAPKLCGQVVDVFLDRQL